MIVTDQSGKIVTFRAGFLSDGILHNANDMQNRTEDFAPDTGKIDRPVAIVRDSMNRLYIL